MHEIVKLVKKPCIYFLLSHMPTFYPIKIGLSKEGALNRRMRSYKTHSPLAMSLIGIQEVDSEQKLSEVEAEIHLALSPFRLNGEWFSGSMAMLREMRDRCTWIDPNIDDIMRKASMIGPEEYKNSGLFPRKKRSAKKRINPQSSDPKYWLECMSMHIEHENGIVRTLI